MHIKVSFGKVWSVSEVENFIADPKSLDFAGLDKDAYLELATCAECYCTSAQPMSDAEINEAAAQSIASSTVIRVLHIGISFHSAAVVVSEVKSSL